MSWPGMFQFAAQERIVGRTDRFVMSGRMRLCAHERRSLAALFAPIHILPWRGSKPFPLPTGV